MGLTGLTVVLTVSAVVVSAGVMNSPLSKPINDFSVSLFEKLITSTPGKNAIVSPYSVSTALSVLLVGARGATQTELKKGLNFDQLPSSPDVEQLFKQLTGKQEHVSTANRLLVQKGEKSGQGEDKILDDFRKKITSGFSASVQEVDFTADGKKIREEANRWVKDQTSGQIDNILAAELKPETRAVILNTIHMQGKWVQQFLTKDTKKGTFFNGGQEQGKETDFMNQVGHQFPYTEVQIAGQDVSAIEMAFEGKDIGMQVWLPKQRNGLRSILSSTQVKPELMKAIEATKQITSEKTLNLHIPKFEIKARRSLSTALNAIGVKQVFLKSADLSGINGQRNLMVSDVEHAAVVRVNEEGTEAGAVAVLVHRAMPAVAAASAAANDAAVEVLADHPFLFLIRDKINDVILFMGTLEQV